MSPNVTHIKLLLFFLFIALTVMFSSEASEALAQPTLPTSNVSNTVPQIQNKTTCTVTIENTNYHHEPWPYVVAGLIILTITFVASRIIRVARQNMLAKQKLLLEPNCRTGNYKGGFWDIIREGDYYPSLARFQFILWTFVISFSIVSIYLLMLWNGLYCWSAFPQNILALMGISAGVPIVSLIISREKYANTISGTLPCKENLPGLSTMLLEGGKPTIGRYQMFLWTIMSVIVYLGLFISQINGINDMDGLKQLKLPDIDPSLLFLMGLSQATYLGAKSVARPVSFLTVVGRYPVHGQRNVKRSTEIIVNFSESLNSATVDNLSFGIRKQADRTNVNGESTVLSHDDKIAVFKPSANLEASTQYEAYIVTSIQSNDKKKLENNETWSFETGR